MCCFLVVRCSLRRQRWLRLPVAAGVDGLLVTPRRLEVTRHTFGGSVTAAAPLRIVQVSDLHSRGFGAVEEQVVDVIVAARPDVIVHTGDMLESPRGLQPLREFLGRCPAVPSFAIPGNWEYSSGVPLSEFGRLREAVGIELLVNGSVGRNGRWTAEGNIRTLSAGQRGSPPADRKARRHANESGAYRGGGRSGQCRRRAPSTVARPAERGCHGRYAKIASTGFPLPSSVA